MKKKGVGHVLLIKNNYGVISTNSLNKEGKSEEIPFEITNSMIEEINGESFIKYSDKVEFDVLSTDGVRRQGRIIELVNLSFIGEEKFYKRKIFQEAYLDKVIRKFKEFDVDTSQFDSQDEKGKIKYLRRIGFKPKMMDYLINGVFLSSEQKRFHLNLYSCPILPEKLKLYPENIVLLDKIDQKFRLYLMEWILKIENIIKSYLSEIATNKNYVGILNDSLTLWVEKKGDKHIKRARNEKLFRPVSDEFDYVCKEFCPFEDFLDQLDLTELKEFIEIWYQKSEKKLRTKEINWINDNLKYFRELSILRNAAAHGRPIIPGFMDPDYNANWDLEFDFTDMRTKLKNWELYPICEKFWLKKKVEKEHIPQMIQTVYGNKFRKAWVVLNYLYFNLVKKLDKEAFKVFEFQALHFLQMDTTNLRNKTINLLNLRLADMGFITFEFFTRMPAPYKEIAMEANIIWDHYQHSID